MKKLFIFIGLVIFTISGCSNLPDVKDEKLEIINWQSSIGAIDDDLENFDKQKYSYHLSLGNKAKTEFKSESVEIVLTDWIKQKQIENKVTELTYGIESIIIKGYIIFDTKGLSKEEIVRQTPFIDGVNVLTDTGEKFFIKNKSY